jgi:hypothetical protein
VAEPSHAQSANRNKKSRQSKIAQTRTKIIPRSGRAPTKSRRFSPNNNVKPFDVNQCCDGVGSDALQSKGVRQWKKAEEIGHDHVIQTSGKMHSLRRTIKRTR